MSRNHLLPDFGAMPTHDTPRWTPLTPEHVEIANAIGKQLVLNTAHALGLGDRQSVSLLINDRSCRLLGDSLDDWYLADTINLGRPQRDKVFFLLPLNYRDLERRNGMVPCIRFEDIDFDNRHADPREVRMIHLYVFNLLTELIRD